MGYCPQEEVLGGGVVAVVVFRAAGLVVVCGVGLVVEFAADLVVDVAPLPGEE